MQPELRGMRMKMTMARHKKIRSCWILLWKARSKIMVMQKGLLDI